MFFTKMLVFGILVAAFGFSAAVDLTGCRPGPPKMINAMMQLQGDVTSPGFKEGQNYPSDLFCEYRIIAPFGFRIKLTFAHMDVEPGDMCMRDAVEIVELGQQPRGLGVFCGNGTFPPVVTSTNGAAIIFRSDFMIEHRGFRIQYVMTGMPSVCDNFGELPCRNRHCYNPRNRCDGKDDCGDGTDEERCGFPLVPAQCGIRKVSGHFGQDRVVGGREAEPGSWPWQADLQLSFIHPIGHTCGGTLINSQWVVSAAHCFQQFKQPGMWRIHLGNHHKFVKDSTEQTRYAERIILYPGTTGQQLLQVQNVDMENDLALLKLNAPVEINDSVRPACLPIQGTEVAAGTQCTASGWGTTRGTGSDHVLKEVNMTIQPAQVCNGQMGPIKPETMICVRNAQGFQDVCHGDSGGPLVCEINGKWNVMGATSFGTQGNYLGGLCSLKNVATVFSKVSHKSNWINQQISMYS